MCVFNKFVITALIILMSPFVISPFTFAGDAKNPVEIREWDILAGGRSRDPFALRKDEVWFVGQAGNYLGRLNPETGGIKTRDLDDGPGPHNLIVGSDGMVWYSGNLSGYIGRYNPATDKIEKIEMPEDAYDPHTLVFDTDEKHIWFTAQSANIMGRLSLADKKVDIIPSPTDYTRPYGIIIAPDGVPWIALFGTNQIASINPKTLKLKTYPLPDGARPRRLDTTTNGQVWYVDYRRGYLGRLSPQTGAVKEWQMPSGRGARPYGMAVDAKDRLWFVETGVSPNLFVGFDPASETFFSVTPIPSGAGSVRHMHYQNQTGQVWFGTDENTIGRAQVIPGNIN
jgi:virginiamycin B lyase